MSYTPGPWKAKRTHHLSSDSWYVIVDSEGRGPVMDVGGKDNSGQIAEAKYLITDPEIIQANANLIAAAPEMFELLELALHLGLGDYCPSFGEETKSILAKVKGEKEC